MIESLCHCDPVELTHRQGKQGQEAKKSTAYDEDKDALRRVELNAINRSAIIPTLNQMKRAICAAKTRAIAHLVCNRTPVINPTTRQEDLNSNAWVATPGPRGSATAIMTPETEANMRLTSTPCTGLRQSCESGDDVLRTATRRWEIAVGEVASDVMFDPPAV